MTVDNVHTSQDTFESTFAVHPVVALVRRIASAYVAAYEARDPQGRVVDTSRLLRVPPPA